MISLIMPVYQAVGFLDASINSVLDQTYNDWELILIDDGSTDGSGEICDRYAKHDKRVKVIHQKNLGQASARNVGLDVATGDYIGFIDNDDFLFPEMCKLLVDLITNNQEVDIYSYSYIQKDEKGCISHNEHTNSFFRLDNLNGVEAFLERKYVDIYVWTKLYKKSFLINAKITFEEGRGDEDFLFNCMAFTNAQASIAIDRPLYIYNVRENSTSRKQRLSLMKYLNDTWYRICQIENIIEKKYPQFLYLSRRQSILYMFIMLFVISENYQEECLEYYMKIKSYIRSNKEQVIRERKKWGISLLGVILAVYFPDKLYLWCKRMKFTMNKLFAMY